MVIPTKDREAVVERAIRSCLEQEGVAVEVIVVADGSSPEQAAAYRERAHALGDRVRVLHRPEARGPGAARNRGIAEAAGPYLAALDDDNLFLPGMLAGQHALVVGADDVIGVCGVEIVQPGGATLHERPAEMGARSLGGDADPFAAVRPRAFWSTYLAPTQLIRDAGAYDEDIWFGEHTELLLRLLDRARFATRPAIGARVHRREGLTHASRAWEHKAEGTVRIMERHAARFDRMPAVKARWLDVLGITYLRLGDRARARRAFMDSVRAAPSRQAMVHLAGALTGTTRWLAPGGADAESA